MDPLRGHYPKTFARGKIFGSLAQQALDPGPGSIRQLDLRCQDGLLTAIPQVILQRRPRLPHYLSLAATPATEHDDRNDDHPNYTQDNAKSSLVHLVSPFIG